LLEGVEVGGVELAQLLRPGLGFARGSVELVVVGEQLVEGVEVRPG